MVNYLLDGMTEEEQAQFEDRFFAEDDLFEQLQMLKRELIDAYVRDQLDPVLRQQFERVWLASDEGRREVEFAQALRLSLNERNAREVPAPRVGWLSLRWPLVAALALLVIVAAIWVLRREPSAPRDLASASPSPSPAESRAPSPTITPSPPVSAPAPIFLSLSRRGGSSNVKLVRLPAGAQQVSFVFQLTDDPGTNPIDAVLTDAAGRTLARSRSLPYRDTGNGLQATWLVPAEALRRGKHAVTLRYLRVNPLDPASPAFEGRYPFRILR